MVFGRPPRPACSQSSSLLHDDVWLDVEEQVVVVPAHLQQEGRLLLQRPLQVGSAGQGLAVQLDDDVAVLEAASVGTAGVRGQLDSFKGAGGQVGEAYLSAGDRGTTPCT